MRTWVGVALIRLGMALQRAGDEVMGVTSACEVDTGEYEFFDLIPADDYLNSMYDMHNHNYHRKDG